jgi:hypothetical protein
MGSTHFLRNFKIGPIEATIEPELRRAGANTYVILAGTNTIGGYDDLEHRFDSWPPIMIAPATGWLGELPANPLMDGGVDTLRINMTDASGHPIQKPPRELPKLKDGADAFLYLGPRDSLTSVSLTRAQLQDTPYLKELERRSKIMMFPMDPLPEKEDAPQFPRPEPEDATPLPPPPPAPAVTPASSPGTAPAVTPASSPGTAPAPAKVKRVAAPLPPRPPSQ